MLYSYKKMETVDFSFIAYDASRYYVEDGYKAVSAVDGGWAFLRGFVPDEDKGFIFSKHPILDKIIALMDHGHSGASYAWIMRQMEHIAKYGLEEYKKTWGKTQ